MDLRRAKYILPNLFTLSSIYCGIFSIHLSTTAQSVAEVALAAWLLVVAMVCDAFDGRVARLTKTESEFGMQLDSLADAISFGVAPAFLLYAWGLSEMGTLGLFFAFVYASCAVMRLARFNVLANANHGVMKYFLGLPTPLAAGTIVSVVLAHVALTDRMTTGAELSVAAMAVLLGGLMVSNVRYRTFKDVKFRGRAFVALIGLVAASFVVSIAVKPSVTFVLLMVAYIVLGLGGGILNLGKHVLGHGQEPDFLDDEEPAFRVELEDQESDREGY
ncbi:MAG: CDP-diacylglycerol--serine O-phosphatidyltransferase [Bradymonadaceae bacterium]|nr:CDP-diacylglycerol--serine O-phosphatidyltransferase [Lujinxingiaceae bacterium]